MSLSKVRETHLVQRWVLQWGDMVPSVPADPGFWIDQHLAVCPGDTMLPMWVSVHWVEPGGLASALAAVSSGFIATSVALGHGRPHQHLILFEFELEPEQQCDYFQHI